MESASAMQHSAAHHSVQQCQKDPLSHDCAHCRVRNLSICGALSDEEVSILDRLARNMCFDARSTLFEQDEPADVVYNITSGAVRLYKLLPDGRRQIVGFALPGDFLGLALSEKNVFSADALTHVTACQFSRTAFSSMLEQKPHFLRRLLSMTSHELTLAQDQMVILGRRTAEEKVAAFLLGLRKRWARLNASNVHVPLPMTRQDMGDFLGLTVETVSRMLTRLARDKAIVIVPDGVRLLDVARLEAMVES
jgi:CRP/FNR family transcriptional regulator, anaerobic regulatory protein